ncbi:MAG: hypothetical protein ACRDUV_18495 [Pseudonocardiaceae bacterium]
MSTLPRPRAQGRGQLSAQTLAWQAERPAARMVVRWVWDTLTELERAGHDPGALAALRAILLAHQPSTRAGRCRACPRSSWRRLWRRPAFPCGVWTSTHFQLQGFFSDNTRTPRAVTTHSGRDGARG